MAVVSVQFRTAQDAVKAFENLDCEAWSLWQGKQFIFKGIGAEELRAFLDMMNTAGGSNAVYTVAYYEGIEDKKEINSKTAFDGSYNFRLNSDNLEITNGQYKQVSFHNELQSKVGALENKLDAVLDRLEDEQVEGNKLGVIGDILNHPVLAGLLPKLLETVFSKLMAPGLPVPYEQQPKLAKVAGIGNILEQDAQLETAISRLLKADEKLSLHLTKLADLSERDPKTFAYIISMLDNM